MSDCARTGICGKAYASRVYILSAKIYANQPITYRTHIRSTCKCTQNTLQIHVLFSISDLAINRCGAILCSHRRYRQVMLIYFLRPFYYYLCVIQHILVCTILALCTLEQMQTPALGCNFSGVPISAICDWR